MPSPRRAHVLLVALVAALVQLPGAFFGIPFGTGVVGGLRVFQGDVPYRDFWSMYAPGEFYAIAGLFELLGPELLVQGVAAVLVNAMSVALFFSLCRRVGLSLGAALGWAVVFLAMVWRTAPELGSYPPALCLWLGALLLVVRFLQEGGGGRLFAAGFLLGLAACFKHDVGAYVAAGAGIGLLLAWAAAGAGRPAHWLRPAAALGRLGLGCALVVVPAVVAVGAVAGRDAWRCLIVFPATEFAAVRAEPFPGLLPDLGPLRVWLEQPERLDRARDAVTGLSSWLLCNVPQLVFVGALATVLVRRRRMAAQDLGAAVLCLSCLPFFWAAAHVQQNTHLWSMAVLTLLLLALAWRARPVTPGRRRLLRAAVLLVLLPYTAALAAPAAMGVYKELRSLEGSRVLDVPGARGVRVSADEHAVYAPIARFVRRHTRPDERIYVGVKRHDAVVITDQRFYLLTGRRNATRYNELHPGVVDRRDVQQEIIEDLERHRVRCVVLWHFGWTDETLDRIVARRREELPDVGSDLLDRWIEEHYDTVARHGEYAVLWRKDAVGPR